MAENPATWGPAEKVIDRALGEAQEAHDQVICGWSTPKRIAEALREAGLLMPLCPGGEQYLSDIRFHTDGMRCKHRRKEA